MSTISAGTTSTTTLVASGDTTGSLVFKTNDTGSGGTTAMTIDASQNVGIGTSSPGAKLDTKGLVRSSIGTGTGAGGAAYAFYQFGTSTNATENWHIGTEGDGSFRFYNQSFGAGLERMRIDSSGNFRVGDASYNFTAGASGQSRVTVNNDYCFQFNRKNGTGVYVYFTYNTTDTGTISTNGTTTSYNTSSDYRLKENVQPMQNALGVVAQLKPVTYTWKADGSAGQGFVAHELQAVVPDCVTGEKDAVDADGNPIYQGIDTSFLVATLTAAIQELKAELDATKAEVAALKEKI